MTNVCDRLSHGTGVASIFRLDTSYGGGKTHGLIALVHAARTGRSITNIEEFVARDSLPSSEVKIAAFDGENADPANGRLIEPGTRTSIPIDASAFDLLVIQRVLGQIAAAEQGLTSRLQKAEEEMRHAISRAVSELVPYGVSPSDIERLIEKAMKDAEPGVKRGLSV